MAILNMEKAEIRDIRRLGAPISFEGVAGVIRPRIYPGSGNNFRIESDSVAPKDFLIPLPPDCHCFVPLFPPAYAPWAKATFGS